MILGSVAWALALIVFLRYYVGGSQSIKYYVSINNIGEALNKNTNPKHTTNSRHLKGQGNNRKKARKKSCCHTKICTTKLTLCEKRDLSMLKMSKIGELFKNTPRLISWQL